MPSWRVSNTLNEEVLVYKSRTLSSRLINKGSFDLFVNLNWKFRMYLREIATLKKTRNATRCKNCDELPNPRLILKVSVYSLAY